MKKLLIIFILALSLKVNAQKFSASFSSALPTQSKQSTLTGKSAGYFILERESTIHQYLTIRTGLGLYWYNMNYNGNNANNSSYFGIPITITKYYNGKGKISPFVESGNIFMLRASSKTYSDSSNFMTKNLKQSNSFMLSNQTAIGVRLNFKNNTFITAKAYYNLQLTPLLQDNNGNSQRFNTVGLSVSFGGLLK